MQAETTDSSGATEPSATNNRENIGSTRRGLLAALAAVPALALPLEAVAAEPASAPSEDLTLCHVARAWIDRWQAAGGDIGVAWNNDGSFRSYTLSMWEPGYWEPTDEAAGKLPPHLWLRESGHQAGAKRVLEAMLEMVPGLENEVRQIAGSKALQRWAQA
jgi:hypothetical protein